jgi:hypothetical protein
VKADFRSLRLVWYAFFVVIVASACSEDEADDVLFVDESLRTYFYQFETEAALRGIDLNLDSMEIEGYLRLITAQSVIGQCAHQADQPSTVIIDVGYWNTATDLEKEFLVFHELGHCALRREHLDDSDGQGDCISIMTSGVGGCHIRYTSSTRTALLDELFTP